MDSIKNPTIKSCIHTVNALRKKMKSVEEIYKTYKHNPPHLFRPNAKYFITAAAYKKQHLFEDDDVKHCVLEVMFESFTRQCWKIEEWVLLDNHYHLMADAPEEDWKFGSYYFKTDKNDEVRKIMKKYPCDRIRVEDDF